MADKNKYTIRILDDCSGSMRLHNLCAVDQEDKSITMPEGTLIIGRDYKLLVYILGIDRVDDLPFYIIGDLMPQGMPPRRILFYREPDADSINCPYIPGSGSYAYVTDETFDPYELWDMSVEEWRGQFRRLNYTLWVDYGEFNTLEGHFNVLADLSLDCLNDTSVCFVPANYGEHIDFEFWYAISTGLDMGSMVYFEVYNNSDGNGNVGDLVYKEQIHLNNWHIPDYPENYCYEISIIWDGRCNQGQYEGHLADPENGQYAAQVHAWIADPGLSEIWTNLQYFNVVPKIDSVLLTHNPDYPPPATGETTTLYAIIKGKIDDSPYPGQNYRFYRGPGLFVPNELHVWNIFSYHFNDLPTGEPPELQQYYYEDNLANELQLREWNQFWWGPLRYTWYVYHDRRYREHGENQIAYDKKDTSYFPSGWGHSWKTELSTPDNWCHPDEIPYMRLLTGAAISDTRNSYFVQDNISAQDSSAHKVIFSDRMGYPDMDIVEWAKTHIGVPYQAYDGTTKNPYRRIECSGLVTTTKIQEIGSEHNQLYRIGWILAKDYDNGYYGFGPQRITISNDVGISTARRGDIIVWKRGTALADHVTIIEYIRYDNIRRRLRDCYIIHAYGWEDQNGNLENGRVRYDDFRERFWGNTGRVYKFKRLAE